MIEPMKKKAVWLILSSLPALLFIFILLIACLVPFLMFAGNNIYNVPTASESSYSTETPNDFTGNIPDVLPQELKYVDINTDKLRNWLDSRNSILSDEPYFSTIISTAKKYDINPCLLFAITGQEQSFVPRSDKNAYMIANNPFNVYHSWYEYNTQIGDSVAIACGTVINLSKGRPLTVNPIAWMNTRGGRGGYAEDGNWWIGVTRFFDAIRREVKTS